MTQTSAKGSCTCGAVRFRMKRAPMFVHCCHCSWCQRETGTAFALNALLESSELEVLSGSPVRVPIPSESGQGQVIVRCADCQVALWSHYAGAGDKLSFVRVGTLELAERFPPDVHIYTESRQPWVEIPAGVPAFEQYYDARKEWPEESQQRFQALKNS